MPVPAKNHLYRSGWIRIVLLVVLGYEAAGCLAGGLLLMLKPDGSYMDMPVRIMHGAFTDFLVPGILLFCLGIINTRAFLSVLRKKPSDWFDAGLGLGGLFIWFVVEIIILQELHWLHLMWGLPVLAGWMAAIPLIASRNDSPGTPKVLLSFGIVSSLWYAVINAAVPLWYEGYNAMDLTVSELSAIGAPTRLSWVLLATLYPLLFAAFGWGVLGVSGTSRSLRFTGWLILIYCAVNLYWPPMHMREALGAGMGSLTDALHIGWASVTVLFMILLMVAGARHAGRRFRNYTYFTFGVFLLFGCLSGIESPGIQANLPTPFLGLWERLNIGAFMLWIAIFAGVLIKQHDAASTSST